MQSFTSHTGVVAALDRANIDTDQIIPKQFLKRIERSGFGQYLFYDWRFEEDGQTLNPQFELNLPRNQGASILVARRNFGSGSSREHAVWAIDDYGIRAVIAPSFADIFYNNCFKNGVLPIALSEQQVQTIFERYAAKPGYRLSIDLASQLVRDDSGFEASFDIDPSGKHNMLNGLDDIGMTMQHLDKIEAYETARSW